MFTRRTCRLSLCSLMLLGASFSSGPVLSQSEQGSREREMLRRTQLELRRLQQENATLLRDKTQVETELAAAQAQSAGREDELAGARRQGGALQAELAKLRGDEQALQQRLQQATDEAAQHQAQAEQALAQRDAEIAALKAQVQSATAQGQSCEAKNAQLYEYGQAMLQQYRDKGVWDSLRQQEPVLGLRQVQIENTLEEYRDKLASQRIAVPSSAAATP